MHHVNSSTIQSVGYDNDAQELHVKFRPGRGGRTYIYSRVSPEVYRKMMDQDSVGRFFLAYVKDVYKWRQE
jgi:hypothetical protein